MPVYVLHVIGGNEYKIRAELLRKGYTVYLPRELVYIRKQGKYREQERLVLPSYVFIDTKLTERIYYDVTGINNVIRFLGRPTPLGSHDRQFIEWLGNDGEIIKPSEVTYDGSDYKVLSGIIKDHEEKIIKYDKRQNKAKIRVNIAGIEKTINLPVKFNDKVYPDSNVDSLHCSKDKL